MSVKVKNLYLHADGGYYCLLSDDAPMKHPSTGEWIKGVVYIGSEDEKIRSTSLERFATRFEPVAEYTENDDAVLRMIRRANPGESDFDFIQTMEAWHEAEMGVTGHMLELAVGAAAKKLRPEQWDGLSEELRLTITTEDLQDIAQNYEIERVPEPHGFTFRITKSFPKPA